MKKATLFSLPLSLFLFLLFLVRIPAALAEKVFVYCSEASPSSFGPAISTSGTALDAAQYTVFSNLVRFKLGETSVIPSLAEKWDISKDGLTYTFHLKKGVKFHSYGSFTPTRDLQADDVLFSFNRQRQKDHPFHMVNGGSYEIFESMDMGNTIKDIEKVDNYTVKFVLNYPEAPFLANLAMGFTSIYSQEYATFLDGKKEKEKIDFEPVGTGPFKFVKYVKDTLIRYEANPDYFEGKPKIDKLIFSITPDASVRYQKLKTGECHFVNEPSPMDIPAMKNDKSLTVMTREGLNVGYLGLNVEKAPLDNPLVRKAINHALNRSAYIEAIYQGQASIAENPIPPTMWSYHKKLPKFAYDPNLAKKLLKKAGLPNGFEAEIWTLPVSRPYNPNGKKMGEMMQADLAKVGIKVKLVSYDWPTYLSKTKDGEHQMAQLGWTGDNGDPDNFMAVLLSCAASRSGSNISRWCHKPFDDLIQKAKRVTDLKERTKLYEKAQEVFKKEAPWVPLAHSVVFKTMSKKVKGFVIDPLGANIFTQVDLE